MSEWAALSNIHVGDKNWTKNFIQKTQTRYYLEDSENDDRMMIKCVLKKQDEGHEMDSGGL